MRRAVHCPDGDTEALRGMRSHSWLLSLCPGQVPYGLATSEDSELVSPHEEVIPEPGGTMAHGLVLWVTQAGAAPGRSVKEQQRLLSFLPHPPLGSGVHKHPSMQLPGLPLPGGVQFTREAAEAPAGSLLEGVINAQVVTVA